MILNPRFATLQMSFNEFDEKARNGNLTENDADKVQDDIRAVVNSVSLENVCESLPKLREEYAKKCGSHRKLFRPVSAMVRQEKGMDGVQKACRSLAMEVTDPDMDVKNPSHLFEAYSGALWQREPFMQLVRSWVPQSGVSIEDRVDSLKSARRLAEIAMSSQSTDFSSVTDFVGCRAVCDTNKAMSDLLKIITREAKKSKNTFKICAVKFESITGQVAKDDYQDIRVLVSVGESFIREHFPGRFPDSKHLHIRHVCELQIVHKCFHAAASTHLGGDCHTRYRLLKELINFAEAGRPLAQGPIVMALSKQLELARGKKNFVRCKELKEMITEARSILDTRESRIKHFEKLKQANKFDELKRVKKSMDHEDKRLKQLASLAGTGDRVSKKLELQLEDVKHQAERQQVQIEAKKLWMEASSLQKKVVLAKKKEEDLDQLKLDKEEAVSKEFFDKIPSFLADIRKLELELRAMDPEPEHIDSGKVQCEYKHALESDGA